MLARVPAYGGRSVSWSNDKKYVISSCCVCDVSECLRSKRPQMKSTAAAGCAKKFRQKVDKVKD